MLTDPGLPADLASSVRSVLERHPEVRLALVFGSRARGAANPESDLDLAVETVRGRELDRLALMAELRSATGLDVDVVDVTPGRPIGYPLLKALNREGRVIYEAERHAEAELRTRALLQASVDRPGYERMRDAYLAHLATPAGAADG